MHEVRWEKLKKIYGKGTKAFDAAWVALQGPEGAGQNEIDVYDAGIKAPKDFLSECKAAKKAAKKAQKGTKD